MDNDYYFAQAQKTFAHEQNKEIISDESQSLEERDPTRLCEIPRDISNTAGVAQPIVASVRNPHINIPDSVGKIKDQRKQINAINQRLQTNEKQMRELTGIISELSGDLNGVVKQQNPTYSSRESVSSNSDYDVSESDENDHKFDNVYTAISGNTLPGGSKVDKKKTFINCKLYQQS